MVEQEPNNLIQSAVTWLAEQIKPPKNFIATSCSNIREAQTHIDKINTDEETKICAASDIDGVFNIGAELLPLLLMFRELRHFPFQLLAEYDIGEIQDHISFLYSRFGSRLLSFQLTTDRPIDLENVQQYQLHKSLLFEITGLILKRKPLYEWARVLQVGLKDDSSTQNFGFLNIGQALAKEELHQQTDSFLEKTTLGIVSNCLKGFSGLLVDTIYGDRTPNRLQALSGIPYRIFLEIFMRKYRPDILIYTDSDSQSKRIFRKLARKFPETKFYYYSIHRKNDPKLPLLKGIKR